VTRGEPQLLSASADPDALALARLDEEVRSDVHRTYALVRFRRVEDDGRERWVAWHRTDHRTLALSAPHFVRRFRTMAWSILSPDASAHWDGARLVMGPGTPRDAAPDADGVEALWRTYYASTFNPARLDETLLRRHLPTRFWRDLPEAREIPRLVAAAGPRVARMIGAGASASSALVPATGSLAEVAAAAARCDACGICARATAPVFGEGRPDAPVVLVGEQPGDEEDLAGRPFVGPAGAVLEDALARAGVDRGALYVTNAVKGFKHELRAKRRIHQRPAPGEVLACRGWLEAELRLVRPRLVVALGVTAAQALLGGRAAIARLRGALHASPLAPRVLATWHPAAILRAPDAAMGARMRSQLVEDLARAAADGG
jgi:uracil-DNA glycosylase